MNLDTPQVLYTGAPDHEPWDADVPGRWYVAQCSRRTGKVLWLPCEPALDRQAAMALAALKRRNEPNLRLTWRAVLR